MTRFGALPFSNRDAWIEFDQLLSDPAIRFVSEPADVDSLWRTFTDRQTSSPKLWMDAYLAAFAVAGKLRFITMDLAFRQFDGLNVHVIEA